MKTYSWIELHVSNLLCKFAMLDEIGWSYALNVLRYCLLFKSAGADGNSVVVYSRLSLKMRSQTVAR